MQRRLLRSEALRTAVEETTGCCQRFLDALPVCAPPPLNPDLPGKRRQRLSEATLSLRSRVSLANGRKVLSFPAATQQLAGVVESSLPLFLLLSTSHPSLLQCTRLLSPRLGAPVPYKCQGKTGDGERSFSLSLSLSPSRPVLSESRVRNPPFRMPLPVPNRSRPPRNAYTALCLHEKKVRIAKAHVTAQEASRGTCADRRKRKFKSP